MDLKNVFQPLTRSAEATILSGGLNLFGARTKQGIPVNTSTALTLSAFYNGIEIIGNDYAKLPKAVFKKSDSGREKQNKHPLHYLIATRPNASMSAFMFDKMLVQYAILKGNGYAEIIRNPNTARPIAFDLIDQEQTPVDVIKYKGLLYYKFGDKTVEAANMIHIPGFSFNGITGVSVITHAANSLGIDLSSQEFASEYYKQKGMGTGVVTVTTEMDNDAKIRYGNAISDMFQSKNGWNIPIVDEASKFQHIKLTAEESQFLSTHKHGIEEIARWLNIPPHKLKTLENVNNSITENQEIQHANDSILPWAIKFEQEYNAKIFSDIERNQSFYIKANLNALLRSDTKTRTEYYKTAINFGWISRNEVRKMEELNSIQELDEFLIPSNLQTLKQVDKILKSNNIKPPKDD